MREDSWLEAGNRERPTRSFRIPRGNPPEMTYQWIEVDRRSLLPLAISSHHSPESERASYVTLFEYDAISDGSSQLWLSSVVQFIDTPEALLIVRADLSNVSFDVGFVDMVMPIDMSTSLVDNRGASDGYYTTKGGGDWPADIRSYLTFPEGYGQLDPARREQEASPAGTDEPPEMGADSESALAPTGAVGTTTRVGLALLLIGASCAFVSGRKEPNS
jgi:hypothetical protein